jgi:hypothetical protein
MGKVMPWRIYADLRAASGDLVIFAVSGLQREMGTIQIHLPFPPRSLLATWQSIDPKSRFCDRSRRGGFLRRELRLNSF